MVEGMLHRPHFYTHTHTRIACFSESPVPGPPGVRVCSLAQIPPFSLLPQMLLDMAGGNGLVHESVSVDNPGIFTRAEFG